MRENKVDRKSLRVYSRYKVIGRNIGSLLNILHANGIYLEKVKQYDEKKVCFSIKNVDDEKFFAITEDLCYTVKKINTYGLHYPFIFLKKNIGVVVGMVLFLAICLFFSDKVFEIRYFGSGSVYQSEVEAQLEEIGIKKFSDFSDFDFKTVENKILSDNENLLFVSLEKKGNVLSVNLIEKKKNTDTKNKPLSVLYAKDSGIIESVKTYRGTARVKEGDSVKKGDVLIDGVFILNEQTVNVNIIAEISMICEYDFEFVSDKEADENIAVIFAKENFNKEITDFKTTCKKTNGEYIYCVTLYYRVKYTVG